MKKFLLSVATVVAASAAFSADQFYVIMKDGSVESYPTDKVDSLSFDDPQIAKIMGFNDMAAEIVKLKERVEALEAKSGMGDTLASDLRYFVLNDKEAEVIGFVNGSPYLIIPEKTSIGGNVYTITSIGNNAFDGFKKLKTVVLPNSITTIEDGAFIGCEELTDVNIPSGVTTIGLSSFSGCNSADIYVDNVEDSVKFSMPVLDYCKSVTFKDGTRYSVEKTNVSVVAGEEYFVRHPSVDFSFKVKSVKGGYLTKDQVVEIEIEGNIFTMSDAGAVFLMWTEEDGFRMVNMVEAKENAKDIVMYLACATSTADYTITSPTEHPSLVANGALESKFLKRH